MPGDSLTTGYNLAPGEGWVDLLNRETPHLWVNAGVAGDTSTGLLVRLQSQALPQKPDMVLFMGGDNDIMLTGSADQAKSAVMAMVHQCVAAGSGGGGHSISRAHHPGPVAAGVRHGPGS